MDIDWATDLLTGRALPILHDLDVESSVAWLKAVMVLIGCGLPVAVDYAKAAIPGAPPSGIRRSWSPLLDACLDLCGAGLKVVLNVALLFHKAHQLDPDVGASLCAIPVFALLCMEGTDLPGYASKMRTLGIVLTVVVFGIACALANLSGGETDRLSPETPWIALLCLTVDAAYACSDRHSTRSWWLPGRGVLYIVLAFARPILTPLLGHTSSQPLFFFHGALLLFSSLVHAGAAKTCLCRLGLTSVTRSALLFHSMALTLAYKFQWHHPRWATYAVMGLMAAGGGSWLGDRMELTF